MKNKFFGKLLALTLAVMMVFTFSACGKAEATEYDLTGTDLTVADTTFDGDVVITGEGGAIVFTNCVFNGKVVNKGGEGARVLVMDDCQFGKDAACAIESSLKEATMETDLPKILFFCEAPAITCTNSGAVVALAEYAVNFNGEAYPIETAELFNDETTGDMVPYEGQEANFHNVAKWTENGEEILLHLAIYSE